MPIPRFSCDPEAPEPETEAVVSYDWDGVSETVTSVPCRIVEDGGGGEAPEFELTREEPSYTYAVPPNCVGFVVHDDSAWSSPLSVFCGGGSN